MGHLSFYYSSSRTFNFRVVNECVPEKHSAIPPLHTTICLQTPLGQKRDD
ncbi:hypothetical protein YC2023_018289 [Brassica napus]